MGSISSFKGAGALSGSGVGEAEAEGTVSEGLHISRSIQSRHGCLDTHLISASFAARRAIFVFLLTITEESK